MVTYQWIVLLSDGSEHPFYEGPEETDPLTTLEGFDEGTAWKLQAPTLEGNDLATPHDDPGHYLVSKTDVVSTRKAQILP